MSADGDRTYAGANGETLGRVLAGMFRAMRENETMTRAEALAVVRDYAHGLGSAVDISVDVDVADDEAPS